MKKSLRTAALLFVCIVSVSWTAAKAQTYKVLHNFGSLSGDPTNPRYTGVLTQGRDGVIYSSADDHWTDQLGTAFKITRAGRVTVLHRFAGVDGVAPVGGLTMGTGGYFYGTTQMGGTNSLGTIFRMMPNGTVITLHSFTGLSDGSIPSAAPVFGFDGNLYGTSMGRESTDDCGAIYRVTKVGTFEVLHTFTGADGCQPVAGLLQANNGSFYGTTFAGGNYGFGTIFRISSGTGFQKLFDFDGARGSKPTAGLTEAIDGNLYGVASAGGPVDAGVAFKMTPSGVLTVLHSFDGVAEGANEVGGLTQATDGNFYGTNNLAGLNGWGVLFRLTPTGQFKVLHNFGLTTGASPQAALLQHTSGVLFGTTAVGGMNNHQQGTFYSLNLGLHPFVAFVNRAAHVGDTVWILGQGLLTTSAVSFNGVPATFAVVSDTYVKAMVPAGATTGFVTVTTATGPLLSNRSFLVLEK